ncbi:hypothetical protein BGZ92_008763 [Podila epicladia]|nr:hypothetical protein BGZ92_008763 [Podila epicladia]
MSSASGPSKYEPLPGQEYAMPVPPVLRPAGMPKLPFTSEDLDDLSKPRVLISGGGIGSAIALGSAVAPLFVQMGIYDEFVKRGKYFNEVHMFKEDLTPVQTMDTTWLKDVVGYGEYVISRPDLYDLLFHSIPRDRICLGKRILSFAQNENSVLVRCSDNTSYHGDILVGADGAYSAVRQNLYKVLKADKKLPASDDVSLPFSCVCLVGQTVPLDPEEFPHLKEDRCQLNSVLGISTMCSWVTFTTQQNTVCWMVIHFLDKESSKRNDSFRNSEWGPEAAEALAREVRTFKVPGGKDGKVRTLGEYVDRTPRGQMSKIMLEEIVFETWHGGRTMSPAGLVGAVTAIHDAATLANWLSTLRQPSAEDLEKVFKEYRAERYPVAKEAFEASHVFIKNLGKNMMASFLRGMMKRIPFWLWKRICLRMTAQRHQASFLPLVEDKSKYKPMYQRSLHKTLPILQKLADKAAEAAETAETAVPVTI